MVHVSPLQFSSLRADHFLAFAAVSPVPDRTRHALAGWLDGLVADGIGAMGPWLKARESLRTRLGALLGVQPDSLALTSSTTQGIQLISHAFRWREGDGVLVFDGEFPANVMTWSRVAVERDLRVVRAPLDGIDDDGNGFEEILANQNIRLVAVSAVQFQTGRRMPLAVMADICHRHGAVLCVDAIQAAGIVPLDLAALGVDFAVGGGHKWLLGTDGAGWVYVAPGREDLLGHTLTGWLSVVDPVRFLFEPDALDYDAPLQPVPRAFEAGSSSSAAVVALDASIGAILEVGVEHIFDTVQTWHDALEPMLVEAGFVSERRLRRHACSGILSFRPPAGTVLSLLQQRLSAIGIIVTIPDGRLRLAPHIVSSVGDVPAIATNIIEQVVLSRS